MDFAERFADFVQKLGLAWQRVSLAEFFVVSFLPRIGIIYYLVYSDPPQVSRGILIQVFAKLNLISLQTLSVEKEKKNDKLCLLFPKKMRHFSSPETKPKHVIVATKTILKCHVLLIVR